MSITVKDCLNIGLLQKASVIAGKNGLWRPVESVTVFEFNGWQIQAFHNIMSGNEMAITALFYFKEREFKELVSFFQNAVASGVSCFVIFYLGIVIDEIPPEIISIADDAQVPIIVFPRNSSYSYAEVIMPVAEAILNDKRNKSIANMLFSDIINQVISMDNRQQNIQTLLNLLSERTKSNLILTDSSFSPFAWSLPELDISPSPFLQNIYFAINRVLPLTPQTLIYPINGNSLGIRFQPIYTNKLIGMLLVIKPADCPIDIDLSNQSAEMICLFLQLWRLSQGRLTELESQLDGNTQSVRQNKFQKIALIGMRNGTPLLIDDLQFSKLNITNAECCNYLFQISYFKNSIVIASRKRNIDFSPLYSHIIGLLGEEGPKLCLGEMNITDKQDVQSAFHYISQALPIAAKIFPHDVCYSEEQICFAGNVRSLQESMGHNLESLTNIFDPLRSQNDWDKIFQTLATIFLDCNGSLTQAAQTMNLHINTLKYRIGRIKELLGFQFDTPINYSRLMLALAITRLSENS